VNFSREVDMGESKRKTESNSNRPSPYERGKADARRWLDASVDAKAANSGPPPIPDPGVEAADQSEYDRGWNEMAALYNSNPLRVTYEQAAKRQPDKWAAYVALCEGARIDPYPEAVDPARFNDRAYIVHTAARAGMRLEFTRRALGEEGP
jgi:hypothetical protein